MALLDWVQRRKQASELKALARKYGHESIGANGAASRHYEKLTDLRNETLGKSEQSNQKSIPRPRPSWER